jgi:hypothetical protein
MMIKYIANYCIILLMVITTSIFCVSQIYAEDMRGFIRIYNASSKDVILTIFPASTKSCVLHRYRLSPNNTLSLSKFNHYRVKVDSRKNYDIEVTHEIFILNEDPWNYKYYFLIDSQESNEVLLVEHFPDVWQKELVSLLKQTLQNSELQFLLNPKVEDDQVCLINDLIMVKVLNTVSDFFQKKLPKELFKKFPLSIEVDSKFDGLLSQLNFKIFYDEDTIKINVNKSLSDELKEFLTQVFRIAFSNEKIEVTSDPCAVAGGGGILKTEFYSITRMGNVSINVPKICGELTKIFLLLGLPIENHNVKKDESGLPLIIFEASSWNPTDLPQELLSLSPTVQLKYVMSFYVEKNREVMVNFSGGSLLRYKTNTRKRLEEVPNHPAIDDISPPSTVLKKNRDIDTILEFDLLLMDKIVNKFFVE